MQRAFLLVDVPLWLSAAAATLEADPAATLPARYAELSEKLEQSPLQQGLYLESIERLRASQGDTYALVDYPFATVSGAFMSPSGVDLDAPKGRLGTRNYHIRLEESLERWFRASELYARQLHEVDHNTYLTMKHREYLHQQTLQ